MNLKISGLRIGYGAEELCSPISLELQAGAIHFLLGKNGTGKSTFMRSLAGWIPTLSGDVSIDGQNTSSYTIKEMAATFSYHKGRNIIHSRLTAREFLIIGTRNTFRLGWRNGRSSEEIDRLSARFGIQEKLDRELRELSDGEYQKILLTLMMMRNAKVILLDEPLSHLDPPSQKEIMDIFLEVAKERILIISTHHMEWLKTYGQRIFAITESGVFKEFGSERFPEEGELQEIYGARMS